MFSYLLKWIIGVLLAFLVGAQVMFAAETTNAAPSFTKTTFVSTNARLAAVTFKPAGSGPFPAIIWNHGGRVSLLETGPVSRFYEIARFFTEHGYVVCIPDRSARSLRFEIESTDPEEIAIAKRSALEFFEINHVDQLAAIEWLQKQPFVDTNRLITMGYSSGGVQSIYEADRYPNLRAAVIFTPNAIIWTKSPLFREIVTDSVRHMKCPMFLIQAQNDFNLDVSAALGAELVAKGKPSKGMVYPPHGASQRDANLFALTGTAAWGKDVLEFLDAALIVPKPASR